MIAADGDIRFYDPRLDVIPDAELPERVLRQEADCRTQLDRWNKFRRDHPGAAAKSEHQQP